MGRRCVHPVQRIHPPRASQVQRAGGIGIVFHELSEVCGMDRRFYEAPPGIHIAQLVQVAAHLLGVSTMGIFRQKVLVVLRAEVLLRQAGIVALFLCVFGKSSVHPYRARSQEEKEEHNRRSPYHPAPTVSPVSTRWTPPAAPRCCMGSRGPRRGSGNPGLPRSRSPGLPRGGGNPCHSGGCLPRKRLSCPRWDITLAARNQQFLQIAVVGPGMGHILPGLFHRDK